MSDCYREVKKRFPELLQGCSPRSDVSPGWVKLVCEMLQAITDVYTRKSIPLPRILQIKEKFTDLIVVAHFSEDPEIKEVIDCTKSKISKICQVCGERGYPQTIELWLYITCEACTSRIKLHGFRRACEDVETARSTP